MAPEMDRNYAVAMWTVLLTLTLPVLAQNVATVTQEPKSATTTMATENAPLGTDALASTSLKSGSTPTPTDNAPHGNNNDNFNSGGLVNYYFVFIALILSVVGLGMFLMFRRRSLAARRARYSREEALQRDLGGSRGGGWHGERTRGRYWQGRWRSAEVSREEGLNEAGEAPPPYLPKRQSEEGRERSEGEANGLAIPLQTLSREDAGLKPPDYTERHVYEADPHARNSSASASSSRNPEGHTGP